MAFRFQYDSKTVEEYYAFGISYFSRRSRSEGNERWIAVDNAGLCILTGSISKTRFPLKTSFVFYDMSSLFRIYCYFFC